MPDLSKDLNQFPTSDRSSNGLDIVNGHLNDPRANGCTFSFQTRARMSLGVPGEQNVVFGKRRLQCAGDRYDVGQAGLVECRRSA
jgi:hypothetical protein